MLSSVFRQLADGMPSVAVDASTVRKALQELCAQYPKAKTSVFDEHGEIKRPLNVYVNRRDIHYLQGLDTVLMDDDEVLLLLPVGGGSAARASKLLGSNY